MRIIGLATAALVIATGSVASAQSLGASSSSPAASTGATAGATGSTGSSTTRSIISSATGAGGSSGAPVPTSNPLAGATAGTPTVSQALQTSATPPPIIMVTLTDATQVAVYGEQLFTGSFAGTRPVDHPDYLIQPGDQIVINLYGAVNNGGVTTVDAAGNLFIVGVGPVHIGGVPVASLQAVVASAVGRVFTGAVSVYATVSSAGTIGVFVSGDVIRPGRYMGGTHDNVLYYLSQAGGIDGLRGSFRNVTVRRAGQIVAEFDLYDFMQNGVASTFRFQDGDVVFVSPRGSLVGATGGVRLSFAFEAPPHAKVMTGADLLRLARPDSTMTGAVVHGFRNGAPRASFFTIQDFERVVLADGDHVDFSSSGVLQTVTINIKGEVQGPSVYVLTRGTTLSQLLAKIPLEGTLVEPRWVHVQRPSLVTEQQKLIQQELYNLQKQVLTSSPPTNSAAQLATAQATLVNQFVNQAQTIQPDGNIAVYTNGQFQDMRLEDQDTVVLPNRTDVVLVSGEVLSPGGLAHADNMTIEGYVARAGGFAAHANKGRFVLRHQDGSAVVAKPHDRPLPGDEIMVLPTVGNENLQVFIDLTQLLFQMALSSATVISVSKNL
jgi:protein involved in polysaccharide export with SLBB domain